MSDQMRVGQEHAADRLMRSQKLHGGGPYLLADPPPTRQQVSAVLHALADHTLLENAVHAAEELGADRAHLGASWALTTGLGRYLQRMGDWLDQPEVAHEPAAAAVEMGAGDE